VKVVGLDDAKNTSTERGGYNVASPNAFGVAVPAKRIKLVFRGSPGANAQRAQHEFDRECGQEYSHHPHYDRCPLFSDYAQNRIRYKQEHVGEPEDNQQHNGGLDLLGNGRDIIIGE